jgi:hypothetical protein
LIYYLNILFKYFILWQIFYWRMAGFNRSGIN